MNTHTFIKNKYKDLLATAYISGKSVYENELNRLSNLKTNRALNQNHVSIQEIFRIFWPSFKSLYEHKLRPSIIANVERMIACKDLKEGHLFFECPKCDNYHLTGLSCHSRFCASCGHKYRDARAIEIQKKLISVPHRHFVFSIPFDLRPFFWKCRKLFDCLFKTVNQALLYTLDRSNSDTKDDYRLGFVSFLHTSGRSLNPHPHLHVLLAEALIDKYGNKKNFYFFPFERLRKTFMYMFLTNASICLKKYGNDSLYREFNILRTKIIKQYKNGFYTHGPKVKEYNKLYSVKKIANYIARYASHPPIAESNILSLNEDDKTVTWKYTPHEDSNNTVTVVDSAHRFISRLIRHIHDKGFHQLRYYGFYSNKTPRAKNNAKLISNSSFNYLVSRLKWRIMLLNTFKFDPLICICGSKMILNLKHSLLKKYERNYISDA
jgi:hypothetical protein